MTRPPLLVWMCAGLVACAPLEPAVVATAVLSPAGAAVPLSFVLDLEASAVVGATVTWTTADHAGSLELPPASAWSGVALLGFRADRTYEVNVSLTAADGAVIDLEPQTLSTAPASPDVPVPTLVTALPDRMQPGITLLPTWGGDWYGLLGVDAEGHVVYLLDLGEQIVDARPVGDGLLLLLGHDCTQVMEVDWLGNGRRAFHGQTCDAPGIAVDSPGRLHHDAVGLDDGGYVALSKEVRWVQDYPLAPTEISADVVVRFDADGVLRWSMSMADLLDPTRIREGSLDLDPLEDAADWSHANALWVEPDGRVGVSLRHQDAVVMLDPDLGTVDWILGTPDGWPSDLEALLLDPIGSLEWPSHQHAAHRTADGRIALFDNGNARHFPEVESEALEGAPRHSRAVLFDVDEVARTVSESAVYDLAASVGPVYSSSLGDVDVLENGDVLGTFGHIVAESGENIRREGSVVRVVEWDATTGEELWHLRMGPAEGVRPAGFQTYRAFRMPTWGR